MQSSGSVANQPKVSAIPIEVVSVPEVIALTWRDVLAAWPEHVQSLWSSMVADGVPSDATAAEIEETEELAYQIISRATPDEIEQESAKFLV
jgi:hypothetical protein